MNKYIATILCAMVVVVNNLILSIIFSSGVLFTFGSLIPYLITVIGVGIWNTLDSNREIEGG